MSQRSSALRQQPPNVEATGILARVRLEAELFGLDEQMRTFDRIRDQLAADGQDPLVFYRKLQARRGELVATLRAFRSESPPGDPKRPVASIDEPLVTRLISPATFNSDLGGFGFGTSGYVQLNKATELTNVVGKTDGGEYDQYGMIDTELGAPPGEVRFGGRLIVGPEELPYGVLDPNPYYVWEHSWCYLIPFPRPTVPSWLTYRFDALARIGLISIALGGAHAYVAVGETQDITAGTVAADVFIPPLVDVSLGGHPSGISSGQQTVQRSFLVSPDHVPAVAVAVGITVNTDMWSDVDFYYPMESGHSYIRISSQNSTGRIAYSEEPQHVFHPEP